jgi:hypothetical protein
MSLPPLIWSTATENSLAGSSCSQLGVGLAIAKDAFRQSGSFG